MEVIDLYLLYGLFKFLLPYLSLVLLYNSPFVVPKYIVHPFPLDVVLSLSNRQAGVLVAQNTERVWVLFLSHD